MNSDYFVKSGYLHNPEASSLDKNGGTQVFWTEERLRTSSAYQYYVYSLARKRFQHDHLKSIADVGCGPAVKTKIFFGDLTREIFLFDQASIGYLAASQLPTAKFTAIDLEKCSAIGTHKADLVICSDVLEHLHNPIPCIDLCKNLAATGGLLIFSTPERDRLRGIDCVKSGHPQHVREWNSIEFRKLLESCGLVVQSEHLFPALRLSLVESISRVLMLGFANDSRWKSCQVKVCRIA